ncbi:MAG: LacI family DNA-binding transcriptional regulator [Christensenellaceae bacterium]
MKKSRVTIRDVARVARVTPQTVSGQFAMRRRYRRKPAKEGIMKVAAELNYVKNNSASSAVRNSKLIVIVYDHLKIFTFPS